MMRIALIGSNAFTKEMREYSERLKKMGHETEIPYSAEHFIERKYWDDLKKEDLEKFIEMKGGINKKYFALIKNSDAVLVMNFDKGGRKNYIGGNTLMEMAVAFEHGKKIFVLRELPEDSMFHDELVAMSPIVIHDDLKKIS